MSSIRANLSNTLRSACDNPSYLSMLPSLDFTLNDSSSILNRIMF